MQKATPAALVLILIILALILGLRNAGKESNSVAGSYPESEVFEKTNPAKDKPANIKQQDRPWGHELSDIPADQNAHFGRLENGMRYIIYPNAEPPGRVSMRLHIEAGSLMEAENQRGLAHFLEHMMFNGSRNYSSEEFIPVMQRLGIGFGSSANAYTSFDETVYMLDLPDLESETIDLAYQVMRDYGDGALLQAEEIEKERGVILAEKVARDDVGFRLMKQQFKQLLPNSLISHRFPIGLEEVIKNATRERFVEFYDRYYIPEKMTFIVVGDIDVDDTQKRVAATFASMSNPEEPGNQPDLGSIVAPTELQAAIFQDPEVDSTEVSILLARSHTPAPDNKATRAEKLKLQLANAILNRRFERISKEKDSPVASGSSYKASWFNAVDFGSISITAADDRWQDVVPILENEFRRVIEHGFNASELDEVKSNILNAANRAVEQKPSRKSNELATGFARGLNDNSVFSTPETNLGIIQEQLSMISSKDCHETFKKFWNSDGYHLVLTTKKATDEDRQSLLANYKEASTSRVDPIAARAVAVFDYTNFGKSGKITKETQVEDLGITQWQLSNHIRVNLKPTDFEKGKIRMHARIGDGKLTQPADKPMLDAFAQAVFDGGGLGKHSVDDLKRILAGKTVSSSLSIGEDAFIMSGSTTADDFLVQCQIMCASLIDPGYREEALWQFRKAIPMLMQQLKHTPAGPAAKMRGWMYGEDSRFMPATEDQLKAYTIDDAKDWVSSQLAQSHIELSIVGDFHIEDIKPSLLSTFGALPERAKTSTDLKAERVIKFATGPAKKTWNYESKIPSTMAINIWKTLPMRGNPRTFRRLNVLGSVLRDRLRAEVREKLGATYSPGAGAAGSDALSGVGYIIAQSVGQPKDLALLHTSIINLADKLAKEGASQDELDRTLKPLVASLEKTKRDNGYWLNTVMAQCQENPNRLELARTRDQDYKSIKLGEINALAKKYLSKDKVLSLTIQPEKAE